MFVSVGKNLNVFMFFVLSVVLELFSSFCEGKQQLERVNFLRAFRGDGACLEVWGSAGTSLNAFILFVFAVVTVLSVRFWTGRARI